MLTVFSSDSNHEEWVVQPAPPLCEKRQVRPKIFGFPVTEDVLYAWAVKHYTRPGGSLCVRRNAAWTAICVRLPTDHRHVTTIRDQLPDDPEFRRRDQLECRRFGAHPGHRTHKIVFDAIDMGNRPGWFYPGEP